VSDEPDEPDSGGPSPSESSARRAEPGRRAGSASGRARRPRTASPTPDGEHRETKAGQQARAARAAREAKQAKTGRARPTGTGDSARTPRSGPRADTEGRATRAGTDSENRTGSDPRAARSGPRSRVRSTEEDAAEGTARLSESSRGPHNRTAEDIRARAERPGPDRDRSGGSARPRADRSRSTRRREPTRRRILARRWGALAVILGLAALFLVVLFTPLLGVRTVDVSGNESLTADAVRGAAQVPMGDPMLRLDTDSIIARVARLPRVAGVDVVREWPSTVLIEVTERDPIGVLTTASGVHLVDATGFDYATVPAAPPGLPVIQLPSASPNDPLTRAVVSVLSALPAQVRPQVISIGAQTAGSVQFGMAGGRTVRWGSADDSARKSAVLAALLSQPGKVYDVSSPTLPTIRS
jgi:cell division protein FtsQ